MSNDSSMSDAATNSSVKESVSPQSGVEPSIQLCPELQQFYQSHNLDVSRIISAQNPWRFVRLNPRFDRSETLKLLQQELSADKKLEAETTTTAAPVAIPWLESKWGFYALPGDFSLASSHCFRSGRIYGMDISSGASVAALLTEDHDQVAADVDRPRPPTSPPTDEIRVLDLCTCPGLKLLTMADYFYDHIVATNTREKKRRVKVVGVDVNSSRMDKCKAIVQKYWIDSVSCSDESAPCHDNVTVQLYLADGTTFASPSQLSLDLQDSLVFDSRLAAEETKERGKRKRMNKSARARQRKRLKQTATSEWKRPPKDDAESDCTYMAAERFDYVLVDAECSTDGSFKHIRERVKAGQDSTTVHQEDNTRLTDQEKLTELVTLQRRLIESGFRLLKPGGSLVYSTCSLSQDQNERVVSWLLGKNADAFLIPIRFQSIMQSQFVTEGSLKGTVRFYPNLGGEDGSPPLLLGDGFFAAKLGKRMV